MFSGLFSNGMFSGILVVTVFFQVLMVEVFGDFAQTTGLDYKQWLTTIAVGFISIPVGTCTLSSCTCARTVRRLLMISFCEQAF